MPRTIRTPEERLAQLKRVEEQIKAKKQKLNATINGVERKKDTRRKIIAGALALEHGKKDATFSHKLNALIDEYVTAANERALFGLQPVKAD